MNKTEYQLAGKPEYARPLKEAMVLFHLEPAGTLLYDHENFSYLTFNQVGVQILERVEADILHVEVMVWYYDDDGQLQSAQVVRQSNIDNKPEKIVQRLIRLNVWDLMQEITGYYPGPWGILRGVRPVKLVHGMLDEGHTAASIPHVIAHRYGVASSKAHLITDIATKQRPFLAMPGQLSNMISIYIAIPFCPTRCVYCSFPSNTLPRDRDTIEAFLKTLYADMNDAKQVIERYGLRVQNIYLGGGTPTSLCEGDFSWLMEIIVDFFYHSSAQEFTVEAGRPDSLTIGKISTITQLGVNRVSVNPQTMQPDTLRRIGRRHTIQDIIDVFNQFRQNRTLSINMDIIAGLPGETEQDMIDTMEKITSLSPDNLTVHTLALKRGAALKTISDGFDLPGEATTRNMVDIASRYAAQMKLEPYYLYRQKYMTGNMENVGYALPGRECLYNIQIMEERQTILGIGLAATSKLVDTRTFHLQSCYNPKDIKRYMSHLPIYLAERNRLFKELYATRR